MAASRPTGLSRDARVFVAGWGVSCLGTGLVIPLNLIYLHQVRGIPLPTVGLLLAAGAVAGLLTVPVCGIWLDRMGPQWVLTTILVGQGGAEVVMALAHSAVGALPATLLYGASWAPMFPATRTMIAGLVSDPALQQRAFAIYFTVTNAALGVGGLVSAAVADVHRPSSFQAIFIVNTISCLVFVGILRLLPDTRPPGQRACGPSAGYKEVLARRELRLVLAASIAIAFTGFAAMESGLPAFATVAGHLSVHVVALAFTANTALIVAAQLLVLRLVQRLRRSRALALTGLIWAVAWSTLGIAGLPIAHAARVACVWAFAAVFGLGETFMAPTTAPLVNSLADDHTRGRANSLTAVSYSLALIASPAIVTGMLAVRAAAIWIGLMCAGGLGVVAIALVLGNALSIEQDTVGRASEHPPDDEPERAAAAEVSFRAAAEASSVDVQ